MKKVLLLAAVACAALASQAQKSRFYTFDGVGINTSSFVANSNLFKAPAKANLAENQFLLGYYTGDALPSSGSGLPQYPGTYYACAEMPVTQMAVLKNAKLDAVRFGLALSIGATKLCVWGVDAKGTPSVLKEVDVPSTVVGWNTVTFDEPIELTKGIENIIVGYQYKQVNTNNGQKYNNECYPLCIQSGVEGDGAILFYGNLGEGEGFYELGGGALCVQSIVEADPITGYNITFGEADVQTAAMGTTVDADIYFYVSANEALNNLEYTLSIDGKQETRTVNFSKAIPAGVAQEGYFTCSIAAPEKPGRIPFEIKITKINGTDVDLESGQFALPVVTRIVPRYHVVEEFTGTGCGYCPIGWAGMEYTKEHYSDKAGVIAIHQYNSTDPMYGSYYHTPEYEGAPSCRIDRFPEELNPYAENMGQYFQVLDQLVPEVDVTVEATYTDATLSKIDASAVTEFLTDLDGSELVFVLTADGLTGTTSAWKQANYLYSASTSQYPASAKDFCKGGKYGQSSVTLVFNDVMIGSSWPSSAKPNEVAAFTTTTAGEKANSTYTLSLPTKTTLKNALIKDEIYVTAMVIKADGMIANAARCKVSLPTGINTVLAPAGDDAAFDLNGRPVVQNANGIVIKNGKKVIR